MRWLHVHRDIALIFLVAFVLRLSLIGWVHERGYTSDEGEYIFLAQNLSEGKEFVDSNGNQSIRAPLFPYVLALVFDFFGADLALPHLVGALLGATIVVLGFRLSLQILDDRLAALATAALLALYPGLVLYAGMLQTETLYIVFLLIALLAYFVLMDELGVGTALVLGLASGLACLTRAVFVGFFPLMVLLFLWAKRSEMMKALAHALVAVLAFAVVLAPWTLRNYDLHGELIPVSSGGGNSLLTGNNPYATGAWRVLDGFESWFAEQARVLGVSDVSSLSETARSSLSREIALQFIQEEPRATAALAAKKTFIMTIYPISNSDSYEPLQIVSVFADALLYCLLGIGIIATLGKALRLHVLYAAALFFIMIQVILHAEARFRLPIVPLFAIVAGVGGAVLMNRERRLVFFSKSQHKVAAISIGIVVFIVYTITGILHINKII